MTEFLPQQPRRVEKPWGYELIWASGEGYAGKILHINAGEALSYQYHRVKEETVMVLAGTLTLHVSQGDDPPQVLQLKRGQVFHIRAGLRHRFEALDAVELLEVSSAELDDVVRLEDRYGREDG